MIFKRTLLTAVCTLSFSVLAGTAFAQMTDSQIATALDQKDLASIQNTMSRSTDNVDPIVRAMTQKTQAVMAQDPDFSTQMMNLVGQNAAHIQPASVPVVCADMRRIVSGLSPEQKETPLFAAAMGATLQLSKAPVVISAGRPNDCDQALLQAQREPGQPLDDETLLMQLPGMSGPGLPPSTIRPGIPPAQPASPN
ncbi:MAG: hypothetical protein FWF24_00860 [Alphaproteobacteria bacterium]|nr:hypothetical protein [Alphaproteobacteria bacterium]